MKTTDFITLIGIPPKHRMNPFFNGLVSPRTPVLNSPGADAARLTKNFSLMLV